MTDSNNNHEYADVMDGLADLREELNRQRCPGPVWTAPQARPLRPPIIAWTIAAVAASVAVAVLLTQFFLAPPVVPSRPVVTAPAVIQQELAAVEGELEVFEQLASVSSRPQPQAEPFDPEQWDAYEWPVSPGNGFVAY